MNVGSEMEPWYTKRSAPEPYHVSAVVLTTVPAGQSVSAVMVVWYDDEEELKLPSLANVLLLTRMLWPGPKGASSRMAIVSGESE